MLTPFLDLTSVQQLASCNTEYAQICPWTWDGPRDGEQRRLYDHPNRVECPCPDNAQHLRAGRLDKAAD